MEKYTTLVVFITSNIFHLKAIFHFIETLLSTFCAAAAAAHLFIKTKRQIASYYYCLTLLRWIILSSHDDYLMCCGCH